jgi:hypothetical protein
MPDGGTIPDNPQPEPAPDPSTAACSPGGPGPAPLRRLSSFEYNGTILDLLDDDSRPADAFPSEVFSGTYRPDLTEPPVEGYAVAAREMVARALLNPDFRSRHLGCISGVTEDTEAACARSIIETFGAQAFRHPLDAEAIDELVALQTELRANGSFEESIAALLEAILQGPDFLYRLEFGAPDPADPALLRPTGHEMATRLSYLLWGTLPDAELAAAALAGELDSAPGVLVHARRLFDHERSRPRLRQFFEGFLGLRGLESVTRNAETFPRFSTGLLPLMQAETLGFIENEVFEGGGSWRNILQAPRVFVNEELAGYYGIAGVTGEAFRSVEVDQDATRRYGLLTQGSILVNTASTDSTNPFRRGLFVLENLMCQEVPRPPVEMPVPSLPPSGAQTTRELFEATTLADAVCVVCHGEVDPIGFALENYDAAGLWRDTENGVAIDPSASTTLLGSFADAKELIGKVAAHEATYTCFAANWGEFAYGRELDAATDACVIEQLNTAFSTADYDVAALLLGSTQTDLFLLLPPTEETP